MNICKDQLDNNIACISWKLMETIFQRIVSTFEAIHR